MSEFYKFVSLTEAIDKSAVKELLKFIDNKLDSNFSDDVSFKSDEATSIYKSWDMHLDDEVQKLIDKECEDKFPMLTIYSWGRKVPEGLRREKMQVCIEIKTNKSKPKEKKLDNSIIEDIFKEIDNKFDMGFANDIIIKSDYAYSTIKSWTMDLDSDIENFVETLQDKYSNYEINVYGKTVPEGLSRHKREVNIEITLKPEKSNEKPKELTQKEKDEIERKQKEWENHNDNVRKRNKGEY